MANGNGRTSAAGGGIGLGGMIFIVFLFLKLAEIGVVATWSWWWVCCPLWIPVGFIFGVLLLIGGIALIVAIISGIANMGK